MKKQFTLVHKIHLRPTKQQEIDLRRACKAARYAYNWGKEQLDSEYHINYKLYKDEGVKKYYSSGYDLKKRFNEIKDLEICHDTGTATQEAFDDLQRTMSRYWQIRKGKIQTDNKDKPRKDGFFPGWPKFRSYKSHMSFRQTVGNYKLTNTHIRYSKKIGWIKISEPLRFEGELGQCTFTYDGKYWYACVTVKTEVEVKDSLESSVGVDLGVKYLAVTSDGEPFDNPKPFVTSQNKLAKLQRKYDRMRRINNPHAFNEKNQYIPGSKITKSNRMIKLQKQIRLLQRHIANIRLQTSHEMTKSITDNYDIIVLEDLNIKGMMKNHNLSKAIGDAALYQKVLQLEYKSQLNGGVVVKVDRWFPSSKMCNNCKTTNPLLKLSEREWECPNCGSVNHRDFNAAKNLEEEGLRILRNE